MATWQAASTKVTPCGTTRWPWHTSLHYGEIHTVTPTRFFYDELSQLKFRGLDRFTTSSTRCERSIESQYRVSQNSNIRAQSSSRQ